MRARRVRIMGAWTGIWRNDAMKTCIFGLAVGLIVSSAFAAYADADDIESFIASGYARGWTVSIKGNEVCSDPYVWSASKDIECD